MRLLRYKRDYYPTTTCNYLNFKLGHGKQGSKKAEGASSTPLIFQTINPLLQDFFFFDIPKKISERMSKNSFRSFNFQNYFASF